MRTGPNLKNNILRCQESWLIRLTEQPACGIDVQVADHYTNMSTFNVDFREVQRDKEYDMAALFDIQVQFNVVRSEN